MAPIEIDVQSVSRWLQNQADDAQVPIALVDCRETKEYRIAKIDGSCLMPMSAWPPSQAELESLSGKRVIVHCHHGGRSLRVAQWFRQNGHPEASSMAGGIDLWSQEIDSKVPRY